MLITFLVITIILTVISTLTTVANIGEESEPITNGFAVGQIIVSTIYIVFFILIILELK